uniref:EF-hand domain-containing protein n=1 Tax=Marmota marmota marmota TaxID=9994 RepID=A0A8C5Z690_MARMA
IYTPAPSFSGSLVAVTLPRWVWGFLLPTVTGHDYVETYRIFEELFRKLDRHGYGMVDIEELPRGLEARGVPLMQDSKVILKSIDSYTHSLLSFCAFMEYLRDTERKIKLAFYSLDTNNDASTLSTICS